MIKRRRCAVGFFLFSIASAWPIGAGNAAEVPIRVGENGRYLQQSNGEPFFYLADTAWSLFHRLSRDEADDYLQDRAAKGFTVIQAVALSEQGGLSVPNANGHLPLIDRDPTRPDIKPGPDNDYWDDVDYVIDKAESLGLVIGLLPTWGEYWQTGRGGDRVPFTVGNAGTFGEWIGARYRDKPVIWILGGDRNIRGEDEAKLIKNFALGLRRGDRGRNLITFHPRGPGRSSDFFHDAPWLDFNMIQSSHAARDLDNGQLIRDDLARSPPKPTLDGEPRYEGIIVGFYNADAVGNLRFDDVDARQAAYLALLAGACGHAYGNNNIWQMWDHGRPPVLGANVPWHEALDHPGGVQMKYVRRLFAAFPFDRLSPSDDLIQDGPTTGPAKIRSALAGDGSFALVYSSRGEPFSVDLGRFEGKAVRCSWYDPRYGVTYPVHTHAGYAAQRFVPPTRGRGQDWILILDDASRGFELPNP